MKNYYQPEIETMPVKELQALQSERLVKQVQFVYDNVKFYHDKMDEAGVKPTFGSTLRRLRTYPVYQWNNRTARRCILYPGRY